MSHSLIYVQLTATFHLKNTKDWHGEKEFINSWGGVVKESPLNSKATKRDPKLAKSNTGVLCAYINARGSWLYAHFSCKYG